MGADLPIIAVTGKVSARERERCIDAGASDYIPKPVDTAELLIALAPWFPANAPSDGARVTVALAPAEERRARPASILVVDDNFGKRLAIIAVLEALGHTTVEADSGEAALRP